MSRRLPGILVALLALLAGCSTGPRVGTQTPDFATVDADGRPVVPADYRGKVTLYYFWATWYAPCFESTEAVERLRKKYAGRLEVLGIHYNTVGNAVEYYNEAHLGFRLVPDGTAIVRAFGVEKLPTIVIVDRSGKVAYSRTKFAEGDEESLTAAIENALR